MYALARAAVVDRRGCAWTRGQQLQRGQDSSARRETNNTPHRTAQHSTQDACLCAAGGGCARWQRRRQAGRQRSRRAAAAAAAGPLGVSLIPMLLCAILTCREGGSARGPIPPPPPRPGARPITRPQSPHHSAHHTTQASAPPLPLTPSTPHLVAACCESGCSRVAVGHVPLHPPWSCGDGPPGCGSWAGGWPLLRPHTCMPTSPATPQSRPPSPPSLPPAAHGGKQHAPS